MERQTRDSHTWGFINLRDPDRMHDDPDWHNDRDREPILYDEVCPDGEGTDDDWEEDS